MKDEPETVAPAADATDTPGMPEWSTGPRFRWSSMSCAPREKAHTHEGAAIAAARRRLPMVEVDANLTLIGPHRPLPLRLSA